MAYCPSCGKPVADDATFCASCGHSLKPQPASKGATTAKSFSAGFASTFKRAKVESVSELISKYRGVVSEEDIRAFYDARLYYAKFAYWIILVLFTAFVLDMAIVYDHYYFMGTEYPGLGIIIIIIGFILASLAFYNLILQSVGKNWKSLFQKGGYTLVQFKEYLEAKKILRSDAGNALVPAQNEPAATSSNFFVQCLGQSKEAIDEQDLRSLFARRLGLVNNAYLWGTSAALLFIVLMWLMRDLAGEGGVVVALIIFLLLGILFLAHTDVSQSGDSSLRGIGLLLLTIPPFDHHLIIFEEYLAAKKELLGPHQ